MSSYSDLLHAIRPIPGGGEVLVLETGASFKPEMQAMAGAMYSRSADGIRALLKRLETRGPDAFLRANYQIGYGHKSIGDLGEAAIFVDGVSMLCAKAIQDFPLYRGQESSTRYIDFSKQRFVDPMHSKESEGILENWRAFYLEVYAAMVPHLTAQFPRGEGEDEKAYDKAIKARAFDVARAFLPAGASTNVAWMGDLRHINDHLLVLRNHPLGEVRSVALAIEDALMEKFPGSFDTSKRYPKTEAYAKSTGKDIYFDDDQHIDFAVAYDSINRAELEDGCAWALEARPAKTELPWSIRECGTLQFRFLLDFGSFRDLQRQRAVVTRMPLLTSHHGFEEWYIEELPEALRGRAIQELGLQLQDINSFAVPFIMAQYYLPMGMKCAIRTTGDLRALVYLVELRATRFVHPTLRKRAQQMADVLLERFGEIGLVLHLDKDPDRFDIKRGLHDIVQK